MRYKLLLQTLAVGLLVTALYVATAGAQWSTNPNINNAICTAADIQQYPRIVSDGSGGAIIAWQDNRNSTWHIYAQRVDASGFFQWGANGGSMSTVTANQYYHAIASDGAGGAIITWEDQRSGIAHIYAQHVDAYGNVHWPTDGDTICAAAGGQTYPAIVSDGSGGAIITWQDYRGSSVDIYAQRVNASGTVQWTANGVAICTAADAQQFSTLVSNGSGGAIITWTDFRGGDYDIYVQGVDGSGNPLWTTDGVPICSATGNQINPTIVSDGSGGAIIAWQDYRYGFSNVDIYARRVDAVGTLKWTPNGVAICSATGNQTNPTIVSDGSSGAIITWEDYRNGSTLDLYAQRVNTSGLVQWTGDGVAICTATDDQQTPAVTSDGSGGAVITWRDNRSGNADIYARRVDGSGTAQWTANGVAICKAAGDQLVPTIVSDFSGGAIITWQDNRGGSSYDIYAQKVDGFGYLGDAAPGIAKVKDVMNDQGGKVAVMWNPSYPDVYPYTDIMSYAIYRGVKPSAASQSYAVLDPDKYSKWEKSSGDKGKAYLRLPLSPTSAGTIYWEDVGSVTAEGLEGYSYNVSTLSDSGTQGVPMYYFMVRAKSYYSNMFWNSSPDSGYSVDNVPPIAPQNPALLPLVSGYTQVHWNMDRTDPDVGHYSLYRSTATGFPVNSSTRLQNTSDTTVVDSSAEVGQQYFYRVTTVDIHGNESQPTAEIHTAPLSVQLASMTATTLTTGLQLDWTTVSETNSLGFYVERRAQGASAYITVSNLIPGAGTSLQEHHYQWTDTKVTDGNYKYRLRLVDLSDNTTYSSAIAVTVSGVLAVDDKGSLPTEFALRQNYPNPFNPTTTVSFAISHLSFVTLRVYDELGRQVATLVNEMQEPGYKTVTWDAANMPSGLYVYRLTAGTYTSVRKMLMLK